MHRKRILGFYAIIAITFAYVCQSWGVLVSQTESLSQMMKRHSDDLLDGPISKLTLLIRDKQQLRKTYADHWNLLRQELNKVRDKTCSQSHMRAFHLTSEDVTLISFWSPFTHDLTYQESPRHLVLQLIYVSTPQVHLHTLAVMQGKNRAYITMRNCFFIKYGISE